MRKAIYLLLICFGFIVSGCSAKAKYEPLPDTKIITEEPLLVGYITGISKTSGEIQVVEDISKEEALKGSSNGKGFWITVNGKYKDIIQKFSLGNKVAVWDFLSNEMSIEERKKLSPPAKYIVVLEK